MKQLIICEKPSLARSVCKAIKMLGQSPSMKDNMVVEFDDYVVVPAFGHIFGLYDIEDYTLGVNPDSSKHKWTKGIDYLPFYFDSFEEYKYKLAMDGEGNKKGGIKKQYKTIYDLIHSNNIGSIVNCGDADREGEIIVRLILKEAKNTKPVYRLWLPDQEESTICNALKHMESDSKYDNMAEEGFTRQIVDWLYGINYTRYATYLSGTLLREGRIKGAILNEIYERDLEIKNFIPKKYFGVKSEQEKDGIKYVLDSKREFSLEQNSEAENHANQLNLHGGIVRNVDTQRKSVNPPKLFSQSTLQNYLSKKYKLSPDTTLKVVQSLYEKGLVSYPRTPTEYMATAEKEKVQTIVNKLNGLFNNMLEFKDKKSIFDDSKIESHSAITPTIKMISESMKLSELEFQVYEVIRNRFMAVFCKEECLVDATTVLIDCGIEEFKLKGNIEIQKGFRKIEKPLNDTDTILPSFKIGEQIMTNFKVVEKETQPKKHYTVETLNNWMKNPFKKELKDNSIELEEIDDEEEYKAILSGCEIGTEATRAGILKQLVSEKYIELKKTNYLITDLGNYYIETSRKLGINLSKEKTVELSMLLKDVFNEKTTCQNVIAKVINELKEVCLKKDVSIARRQGNVIEICNCPNCDGKVLEKQKSYGCSSNKYKNENGEFKLVEGCGFSIPKTFSGKTLSNSIVKELIENGRTKNKVKGLKSKKGTTYEAYLTYNNGKIGLSFEG